MKQIDLSSLPAPDIVVQKTPESVLQERLDYLKQSGIDIDNFTPSDPVYRGLLAASFRESLIRQDANEQCLGNLLAFAKGPQLDHIGASPLFNVERLANETDEDFRRRIQLAPEASSVAGPEGKYIFEALSAHENVKDASFNSPEPMHGVVTVLSRIGDGTPSAALLNAVESHLMDDGVRPQTDLIAVVAPTILNYSISASLLIADGPDLSEVVNQAKTKLRKYIDGQHRLGGQVVAAGVYGALWAEGVLDVQLNNFIDVRANKNEAPYCVEMTVN